jgi:GT2 family glycosyltransferase
MLRSQPKISISILTYNRCDYLRNLLLSLGRLEYSPLQIIVVDNHSQDSTDKLVKEKIPHNLYLRTESNIGAAARNLGMHKASGEIVVTLDDDITGVTDDHLNYLAEVFTARLSLGALNFRVLDSYTQQVCNWVHHCAVEDFSDKEFLTYEITEGAVAFRKSVIDEVGYYPGNFFLSHEGPDLALRILDRGYQVLYTPRISVFHHHATSGRTSWTNYYYDTRNQFWLAARNLPFAYAMRYLARGLCSMLVYSLRDGYIGYYAKAIIDGLRGLKKAMRARKVLASSTMRLIKNLDKNRPGLCYMIKRRLLRKDARL